MHEQSGNVVGRSTTVGFACVMACISSLGPQEQQGDTGSEIMSSSKDLPSSISVDASDDSSDENETLRDDLAPGGVRARQT
jgi:hypothetical protein